MTSSIATSISASKGRRCSDRATSPGRCSIAPSKPIDKFKAVVARLNPLGERVAKAGLQLAYHNHGYEFVEQNGRLPYDILLKETDPELVKLQVDLYWLAHDSKEPARYWFKRAPGRYVMWHVKDMHKVSRDYTELGNGTIDYTQIWPDTELAGMKHFFVEQGGNFAQDPMKSIEDCAAYVKTSPPEVARAFKRISEALHLSRRTSPGRHVYDASQE